MSNQKDRKAFSELSRAREKVYHIFTATFAEPPSREGLKALLSSDFLDPATGMFCEETLAPLHEFAKDRGADEELEGEARHEFMNLFKVPGAQYVTPYESVFRDTRELAEKRVKELLMGPSAVDVQKWYRLAALEISPDFKDLPDHISLEMSYLAHLCAKEQEFASAGDENKQRRAWEMQRDFLAAHIVSWIGELRDKIHARTQHPYFRAIADMIVEFTGRDLATLENLLGPSSGASAPEYEEVKR